MAIWLWVSPQPRPFSPGSLSTSMMSTSSTSCSPCGGPGVPCSFTRVASAAAGDGSGDPSGMAVVAFRGILGAFATSTLLSSGSKSSSSDGSSHFRLAARRDGRAQWRQARRWARLSGCGGRGLTLAASEHLPANNHSNKS